MVKREDKILISLAMILALSLHTLTMLNKFNVLFVDTNFTNINLYLHIAYAFTTSFCLIKLKDATLGSSLFIFYTFTIANQNGLSDIPLNIILATFIILLGLIGRIIVYKTNKVKLHFFLPLILYAISLIIGGIGSKNVESQNFTSNFKSIYILYVFLLALLFLLIYYILAKTSNISFYNIAYIFTMLGILIVLEELVFILNFESIDLYFNNKQLNLGWGTHNAVGIMLLMCLPFPIYLAKDKKVLNIVDYLICILFTIGIFVTMSRGPFLVICFALPITVIVSIIISKHKLSSIIYWFLISVLATLIIYFIEIKFKFFSDIISKINLETGNGRYNVWKSAIEIFKENKVFGIGLFADWHVDTAYYQFAHSTILQMFLTSGIIGGTLMCIHLIYKYLLLIIKPNKEKIIILLSFILPGIYGLIDVTYLMPNFTITMLLIMALSESEIFNKKKKEEELNLFKGDN